jgi:hypothetical protein
MERMATPRHPHADATYRVILQDDKTYGVEVAIPDSYPTMVKSFATVPEAEAWIAEHKRQAETEPFSKRSRFRKREKPPPLPGAS